MSIDEDLLDDEAALLRRDEGRLLWHLAGAGAQVRRALATAAEFGADRLAGEPPRAVLVAADAPGSTARRLVGVLARDAAPVVSWHGVDLPRWAGPADALLVASLDGRHPRLAGLTDQAVRRGLAVAVVAPPDSPVASAAGRAPLHPLTDGLHPHAARWALQTPLLQACTALGLAAVGDAVLEQVADALDGTAEALRPGGELFTNAAKSLAVEFAATRPLIAGAGALAGVAARAVAESLQMAAGVPAVAVALPDGAARAGALLRGPFGPGDPDEDLFRDRLDEIVPMRTRLLVIGDDGDPADPSLGPRSPAEVQLDEVAARRAASALRRLAEDLGVRADGLDGPGGPALARFAAAVAFGDFTAAYLAFGLGLDPGRPAPGELGH